MIKILNVCVSKRFLDIGGNKNNTINNNSNTK
jgi:hypothetical protein